MKRNVVYSDTERLKLLTNLVAHPEITNPNGEVVFRPDLIARLQLQVTHFTKALEERKEAVYARRDVRSTLQTGLVDLMTTVRLIWHTVRGRVRCSKATADCYGLYGLSLNGNQPKITKRRGWVTVAEQILAGDQIAIAHGLEGIGEPPRETLHQLIETVASQIETLEQKTARLRETVQQVSLVRADIDTSIRMVTLSIDLACVTQPEIAKRELMRVLGFSFQGDTRDEAPEREQTA